MRNLLVLTITMLLASICASAQQPVTQQSVDKVTVRDYTGQQITIDGFGTVVSFRHRTGEVSDPKNSYRVCRCNPESCFSSNEPSGDITTRLVVIAPKVGRVLKRGQSLQVQATITQGDLTVIRRLNWVAGSKLVSQQTIAGSKTRICCIYVGHDETGLTDTQGCSMPPGGGMDPACPIARPRWFNRIPGGAQLINFSVLDLSKKP